MGRNLTDLYISESFNHLVQISGSDFTTGIGALVTSSLANPLNITVASASYAVSASHEIIKEVSSSYADFAQVAGIASSSFSSSYVAGANVDGAVALATNATYAQNTVVTGKNMEATQIAKGTPLYFSASGTAGNLVGVYLADAGNANRMPAGGIAGETLAAGGEGVVLIDGFISGVDTSAFASGDEVYVGVGGGYTNVAPTGSANQVQKLGNVEKSAVNGSGVINGPGASRSLPNLQQGYLWVGGTGDVPQAVQSSSINVISASYAVTASYALNGGGGGTVDTGSLLVTGSVSNATLTFTKGDSSTFDLTVNNVENAATASYSLTAVSASHAQQADSALNADLATTASYVSGANVDGQVSNAASADTATSASHALVSDTVNDTDIAYQNQNNNFTGNQTFDNITVNGTGSFAYIQSVTGSAKIIGDAFVQVNTDSPNLRYGGIQVVDSGSLVTASLQWDSEKDIWMQQEVDGTTAGLITGLSGSKGSEVFPSNNTIVKGTGTHQVTNSSITDDGSSVKINSNTEITGSLTVTGGVNGTITSASYALSASVLTPGNKSHSGVITQFFDAPNQGTQTNFLSIDNVTFTNGTDFTNSGFNMQKYGNDFSNYNNALVFEFWDSFGYNYGGDMSISPVRVGMTIVPSGSSYASQSFVEVKQQWNGTSAVNITGPTINMSGRTTMTDSSGFPLNVDGTANARRLHFDKNPFNDFENGNLGAIRLDGNNEKFYITHYNQQYIIDSQSQFVLDCNVTSSNYTAAEMNAQYAGTIGSFRIENNNGTRTSTLDTDTLSVSGSTTFHSTVTGSISTVYNNNTSSGSIGFWQGSQAEYNLISGSASNDIIYFVV